VAKPRADIEHINAVDRSSMSRCSTT